MIMLNSRGNYRATNFMTEVSAGLSNYFHSQVRLIFFFQNTSNGAVCSPVTFRHMVIHQSFLSLSLPADEVAYMIYLSS